MKLLAIFALLVPVFASALQPKELLTVDSHKKHLLLTDTANVDELINGVKSSQPAWLEVVPGIIDSIPQSQYIPLMNALAASLIRSAPATLKVLAQVDKLIAREEQSTERDRFGSYIICVYTPDPKIYNKQSVIEYFARAQRVLPQAGKAGRSCLELMGEAIAEMKRDNQRKPYKWGDKDYFKSYYPLNVPTETP
ncbi:hypothetical protein GKQ23_04160 [Erwinia sp. E602]|uniref:hypothetical protein n=1 Tax=Erwinia sp. E602 TaxID=2675378 RepID=UPI001BA96D3F|nr:hypothetical protein [Erwinia sp. E602]QUG74240.1 hypothetical protein GKQ23_04160 [Erwinia sp. E602]